MTKPTLSTSARTYARLDSAARERSTSISCLVEQALAPVLGLEAPATCPRQPERPTRVWKWRNK